MGGAGAVVAVEGGRGRRRRGRRGRGGRRSRRSSSSPGPGGRRPEGRSPGGRRQATAGRQGRARGRLAGPAADDATSSKANRRGWPGAHCSAMRPVPAATRSGRRPPRSAPSPCWSRRPVRLSDREPSGRRLTAALVCEPKSPSGVPTSSSSAASDLLQGENSRPAVARRELAIVRKRHLRGRWPRRRRCRRGVVEGVGRLWSSPRSPSRARGGATTPAEVSGTGGMLGGLRRRRRSRPRPRSPSR